MKLVSVNILNFNDGNYLRQCLDAVLSQTYPRLEVTVVDNASEDGSADLLRREYADRVRLILNPGNLGYAAAHNLAIDRCQGEYLMPLNVDLFMTPNFVEEKVAAMGLSREIGMVEGKLLQRVEGAEELPGERILDSTGIFLTRSRRSFDRGHGQRDQGQYDAVEYIFGAGGAAPLYRREMLEDVSVDGEYFDPSFFSYREEVDLAWRAQWLGWKCLYTPRAVAYHVRRYRPTTRRAVPRYLRRLQFRNRYLMIAKNDLPGHLLRHSLPILWFEARAWAYALAVEPHLFKAGLQALGLFPAILRKRRAIRQRRRVSDHYMQEWFV